MPLSPNGPVHALRRQLAREIVRSLGPNSQHVIAPSYGIRQPRMSELTRGLVDRCSVEWLIRRVYRLGGSVSLSVTLGDANRDWKCRQFARRGRGPATRQTRATAPSLVLRRPNPLIPNLE